MDGLRTAEGDQDVLIGFKALVQDLDDAFGHARARNLVGILETAAMNRSLAVLVLVTAGDETKVAGLNLAFTTSHMDRPTQPHFQHVTTLWHNDMNTTTLRMSTSIESTEQ